MRGGRAPLWFISIACSLLIRSARSTAPQWVYWFTVVSIWSAVILTVYSGAIYVWIAYKLLKQNSRRLGHMTPLLATLPGEGMNASGDSRGLAGRQRGNVGMDLSPLAAGRADHPLGPPAAGSLAGAGRAVHLPHRLVASLIASRVVQAWVGPEAGQQAADRKPELAHPAEQMLRSGDPGGSCHCRRDGRRRRAAWSRSSSFVSCCKAGWKPFGAAGGGNTAELRAAPASWIPIALPAALFALMHVRSSQPPHSPQYLLALYLGQMAAELLALGLAIVVLRFAARATAADLGWKPEKLRSDAKLGLLALLAVIGPVLTLQAALMVLVKSTGIDYAPDPVPLFFLALVFGVLYRRTHRIAPSLVLHMAFNATAVAGLSSQGSRDIIKREWRSIRAARVPLPGPTTLGATATPSETTFPWSSMGKSWRKSPVGNSAVSNSRLEVPCLGD